MFFGIPPPATCRRCEGKDISYWKQQPPSTSSNADQESDELDLQKARNNNNELFAQVAYTREALDGENLNLIATKYVQQVERLVQASISISSLECE